MAKEEAIAKLEKIIDYIERGARLDERDVQDLKDVISYVKNEPIRLYGKPLSEVLQEQDKHL